MFKRVAGTAIAVAALSLFPALPVFAADPMPGDPCTQEGLTRPLGNGLIVCQGGTWQPSTGGAPGGSSPGSPPSSSASSAKTLGNFKTVGTALSQATFGSTGRQVADATAWRMPDGRVRLFAFVNEGPMPGLRIATSTSRTGTTFAGESTNPFPDIAVGQPRAWALGGNSLRLFYVQAGNIDTAVSNDGGLTWTKETYAQLQQLVAAGIDVRFDPMYPGGLLFIHSKAIVRDVGTDNAMAFVGSQNPGDNVSLNSERELGILLGKDSIINKMTAVYERDWAASQPLTIVNGVPKNPFSGS